MLRKSFCKSWRGLSLSVRNNGLQYRHLASSSLLNAATGVDGTATKVNPKWKDSAEVVIIGGGALGTSIAYHLAKQGTKDVVLLEKSELTAGSTWHAAGLTTTYHPGINVKHIHNYSLGLFRHLPRETGQEIGLHLPGSIRLLTSEERVKEGQYQLSRSGWHQAPIKMLNPDEVYELCPLLNMDGILGGVYNPGDGHVDPYSLTQAYATGARKYGAEIYMPAPVTGLNQRSDGGWDVTIPQGTIKAKTIINAAGFWGREVGLMSGLELPLIPIHHQYFVTSTLPEVESLKTEFPVIRDLDGSYYLRQERQGLLVGPYEAVDKMKIQEDWWDSVPSGFGKELYESDLDRISDNTTMAMERFPVLQDANISSVISGPIYYTPDILPMVGPHWEIDNYFLCVGFGYGIVHSGGIGKYIADWIQNGEPLFDLIETDPGRFGNWTNKKYVMEKVRESYGLNNLLGYPKEDRTAGRPMRTSAIYEATKAAGADFGMHAGWEVPHWYVRPGDEAGYKPSFNRTNWFEPARRECELVLNKVGISDASAFAKIYVEGKDATKYLDFLVANKLPSVGNVNVSHMITPLGKVYAEVTISRTAENEYLVITGGGSEFHDLRWMQEKTSGFKDVTITNRTDEMACISIAGPKSRKLLSKICDEDVSNKGFKFMTTKEMTVGGVPVTALRVSYTGELGWEFYVSNEHAVQLYEKIMEAGQEFGIDHFGSFATNSLRLEKGFRLWGAEMNLDVNPFEAGLDFFIKLDKGDFIGRSALLKSNSELQQRKLVCLTLETDNVDAEGNESIWYCNKIVGNTTSGSYGYQVDKSICYAYLPWNVQDIGTVVDVELVGKRYKGTVTAEPLVHMEATRTRIASKKAKKMKSAAAK